MTGLDLAPRQHAALLAFGRHVATTGGAPTLRELAEALGIASTNAAGDFLAALRRKGYLVRQPAISRGHRLTAAGRAVLARYGIAVEPHAHRLAIVALLDRAGVPQIENLDHRIILALERLAELRDAGLDREHAAAMDAGRRLEETLQLASQQPRTRPAGPEWTR